MTVLQLSKQLYQDAPISLRLFKEYLAIPSGQENNAAVFQSSYGDGFYATYVGFDEQGQPMKFVTEFIDVGVS